MKIIGRLLSPEREAPQTRVALLYLLLCVVPPRKIGDCCREPELQLPYHKETKNASQGGNIAAGVLSEQQTV